jgi:hypothetical protein
MFDTNLMMPVDVGGKVAAGFQMGQQNAQAAMAKAAMAALVQDPNNPRALAALAKVSPETAMQFRQQQAELAKQQLAQHQDSILKGAEIIRQFQPKDQQSYTAALMAAQQAGIDISQVPQQFNPQYVDGIVKLADALKPQNNDGSQVVVTPQPGAPAFIYDKTAGTTKMIFSPNDGSHPVGSPVDSLPTVATPQQASQLPPGTQFRLPDGRIGTVPGGAGGNASGGFPH